MAASSKARQTDSQDQALLRVERGPLRPGDPEDLVIELVGVVDEVWRIGCSWCPAAVAQLWKRSMSHRAAGTTLVGDRSVHRGSPQLVDVRGAGESAIDADDSDGNHADLPAAFGEMAGDVVDGG